MCNCLGPQSHAVTEASSQTWKKLKLNPARSLCVNLALTASPQQLTSYLGQEGSETSLPYTTTELSGSPPTTWLHTLFFFSATHYSLF